MEKELELVKESQKIIDKMVEEGEIVVYVDRKEVQKIIDEMFKIGELATFKKKMAGMLTGLGLGMIAGYAIFKAIVERKGTQSEVIVEEVK